MKTYQLCHECMIAAANDDYSGVESDERAEQIQDGLKRLGWLSSGEEYTEHSMRPCDCCRTHLHGDRYEFCKL